MAVVIFAIFVLLVVGLPIGIAFALPTMLAVERLGYPLATVTTVPHQAVSSFTLLAIPFFLLLGQIMDAGGLMERLVALANRFMSRLRGALGYVTIVASAFVGAMTGSSVATVAAISSTVGQRMIRGGYKPGYVSSLTGACGLLGVLIPPSIPLIVYGAVLGISVRDLFVATLVPGFLMVTAFLLVHRLLISRGLDASMASARDESVPVLLTRRRTVWQSVPALTVPLFLLGGIYGGVFTPTEAAAAVAFYSLVLVVLSRRLEFSAVPNMFYRAAIQSAAILSIIAFVSIFNRVVILEGIPQELAVVVTAATDNPIVFLLLVNLALFAVGMFMETNAAVLLMGPLLAPAAEAFGIDPFHFGIILVSNIDLGLITPPMAANLYVASKINGTSLTSMLPFIGWYLLAGVCVVLTVTYVPFLTTWWQ